MINWRGKDYQFWTDALEEQVKEIERLTADNALLQVAAKRADNIERHRDELQARVEALECKIDNANMAASETARDWEQRCYSIMSALGEDYAATEQERE